MWIYEQKEWPEFKLNLEALKEKLFDLKLQQQFLNGCMHIINQMPTDESSYDFKEEANLDFSTSSVVNSAAIEGEFLDHEEVRSSIAKNLELNGKRSAQSSDKVEGIVKLTLDAMQNFQEPLTRERLFKWHSMLFPTGYSGTFRITVGKWRVPENDPMQVVSGNLGRERVHFEAPKSELVDFEMERFLSWFEQNRSVDLITKAGISHLWFETIHPFADGNGRIGRTICDLALARAFESSKLYFSLSSQIANEKMEYYRLLEKHQRGGLEITEWLEWFLDCLEMAMASAVKSMDRLMVKARTLDYSRQFSTNTRQRKIINRMLEPAFEGFMNTSKYAKIAKCSTDTALRDITELKKFGILLQNPGKGKKTSYRLYYPSQKR